VLIAAAAALVLTTHAGATTREEHVTGGVLDLVWAPGFGVSNNLQPLTLSPSDPAYANPSGDHTVAVATNSMAPDSGGIILTATDPGSSADYTWEGFVFTGAGNTRRGLVVRADAGNQFQSCYQFVIQSGLFQLNFRKLDNGNPTTLGSWFANILPGGVPAVNTWHSMKVIALGGNFRCFWDGFELTTTPIFDTSFASGWVGVYNFRFDLGGVPVYFDDLVLSPMDATPATHTTWGSVKALYRR
jgi:hypothetical protein